MAEVGTDKRELRLFYINILYPGYSGNGIGAQYAATYAIYSIGRVDNHPSVAQARYHLSYMSWLRIIGMYLQQHTVSVFI
jgi:hypothetical protein